ncbi:MAG: hypothetical protein GY948_02845, partial [Alphaproteobacteria bacterium]|nr:hypothetical protein [Alphaproteobacteria bacterium]
MISPENALKPLQSRDLGDPTQGQCRLSTAAMEDVPDVCTHPHDPARPLVCLDETSRQLTRETRTPAPMRPDQPARFDHEYERNGVASLFMVFAPLEGWRHVAVRARRTAMDDAHVLRELADTHFQQADRIDLVHPSQRMQAFACPLPAHCLPTACPLPGRALKMPGKGAMDNLDTHRRASLYEAFPAAEAKRISDRFEWHCTPKHGSWLNIAECELSVLARPSRAFGECPAGNECLGRCIPVQATSETEVTAWTKNRNNAQARTNWHFTTDDARTKLLHLYPHIAWLRGLEHHV